MKGNDIRGVFFGIEGPDASLSHYLYRNLKYRDYVFLASRVGSPQRSFAIFAEAEYRGQS